MTTENCLTFFLLILFAAVPKRRQYSFSSGDKKKKKKNVYIVEVINTFRYFIMKALPITSFPNFFSQRTTVFLIWCQENLVTANTMFSKAVLASEGGKLSRASNALFPW